jgi:hypothetical protein
MGNYGIKIAKSGYSYDDGDENLVLNSEYPMLKIKGSGSGTLTLSSGGGTKTIYTHDLNYKPMFYVWINYLDIDSGDKIEKLKMCSWRGYQGLGVWSSYYAYATTTTIELSVYTAHTDPGNETLDYNYVVYYDPIT